MQILSCRTEENRPRTGTGHNRIPRAGTHSVLGQFLAVPGQFLSVLGQGQDIIGFSQNSQFPSGLLTRYFHFPAWELSFFILPLGNHHSSKASRRTGQTKYGKPFSRNPKGNPKGKKDPPDERRYGKPFSPAPKATPKGTF